MLEWSLLGLFVGLGLIFGMYFVLARGRKR